MLVSRTSVESTCSVNFCECCNCAAHLLGIHVWTEKIVLEFHTFTAKNRSRIEVVTMNIDRLLHECWEEMSVSGHSCTTITKVTPDLGYIA